MRFDGEIAGLGSTSGVRVVVGAWRASPYGSFTDVMVEQADGHRVLLAPSAEVAELVGSTYRFDEVLVGPVTLSVRGDAYEVVAPGLELRFTVGGRTRIGRLLALVPRRIATAPRWLTVINPLAKVIMKGVATKGTAGGGRTEYYGAYDVRALTAAEGSWRGAALGTLTDVQPPVRFGFGSTPPRPALTSLVTTILETPARP